MKVKIASFISTLILLFLIVSGLFEELTKFFVWLVMLNLTESSVSAFGEIFVKVTTFVVTFGFVGALFNGIGWFNSSAMKIVYYIVSTLVSFALCCLVMVFETHIWVFFWIFVGLLLALVAITIAYFVSNHKSKTSKEVCENE